MLGPPSSPSSSTTSTRRSSDRRSRSSSRTDQTAGVKSADSQPFGAPRRITAPGRLRAADDRPSGAPTAILFGDSERKRKRKGHDGPADDADAHLADRDGRERP